MSEIGEPVAIAELGHEGHSEDTCAFHNKDKPTSETNVLTDDMDEDALEVPGVSMTGIAHKNSAAKLGSNLTAEGHDQPETTVQIEGINRVLPVHTAAHHLIPGNASLKKSKIMSYLHQEGTATGNIGYDINNYQNGSWLPGNYALRGEDDLPAWGPQGVGFTTKYSQPPDVYAFAAIAKLRRQFHDAHVDYSKFVIKVLNLLAKKLKKTEDLWCPLANNQPKDPQERQLKMLVARLNTVSLRMKTMLESPGPNWKTNVYTSRFSQKFIRRHVYGGS